MAAVYASWSGNDVPLGTAVVIDDSRLLTSAHVVRGRAEVWVAFPMNQVDLSFRRTRSRQIRIAEVWRADLAVIDLEAPVPAGVVPARLRQPIPDDLVGMSWWAYGFRDEVGNVAGGVIGAPLGYGWIRLDTDSRYLVEPGFSGGGLWCPDYDAVVAVVGEANDRGDGRAITLHHADGFLPAEKIHLLSLWRVDDSDEVARTSWGWVLSEDPEVGRHWEPRARGVMVAAERGNRFRGRRTALTEIVSWLDRPDVDRKVLVITGSPGAGKSALLGRVVVTADPANNPADDAPRATTGSISCAVHAKGKTALDVAREIARAASAPMPERAEDLPAALRSVLAARPRGRFNVVIDALDEASEPNQARRIVRDLILPIAVGCASVDAQVVVGTRRHDDGGDLLAEFAAASTEIDLDLQRYFSFDDLAAYAQATLQLQGDERPGNPYQSDAIAAPVAQRVAELARQNFLIAGLVARSHGLYDTEPVAAKEISFIPTVDAALHDYLDRLPAVDGVPPRDLLLALAYIDAPGITAVLWQAATLALTRHDLPVATFTRFARTSAANFLIETSESSDPQFRLFHQALNDALGQHNQRTSSATADHAALTRSFVGHGRHVGWSHAPTYLFRSLPRHAQHAGLVDELLTDTAYVLHTDLRRLIPTVDDATTADGWRAAQTLRRTPQAIDATPTERLAMLTVTEAFDSTDTAYRDCPSPAPYRARWARTPTRAERTTLTGHGRTVDDLQVVRVEGQELLVSSSADNTVRVWDPETGVEVNCLDNDHRYRGDQLHVAQVDGLDLIALLTGDQVSLFHPVSGVAVYTRDIFPVESPRHTTIIPLGECGLVALQSGTDVTVWDPTTGADIARITAVASAYRVQVDGIPLLALVLDFGTLDLWDPRNGIRVRRLGVSTSGLKDVLVIGSGTQDVLVLTHYDGTVKLFNLNLDGRVVVLPSKFHHFRKVVDIENAEGRRLLVLTSDDGDIELYDPVTGEEVSRIDGSYLGPSGVVRLGGRSLLVLTERDAVELWDIETRTRTQRIEGHTGAVTSVCTVRTGGRELIATASYDETVRLWDSDTRIDIGRDDGLELQPSRVCALREDGRDLLTIAGASPHVRLWGAESADEIRVLTHDTEINSVCALQVANRQLLATGGKDYAVHLWDPRTGTHLSRLTGHRSWILGLCTVRQDGRELIASASHDATVRIWDPETGAEVRRLKGHRGAVNTVCTVDNLLASGSRDGTVRVWNPQTGAEIHCMRGHDAVVYDVCAVGELLASASVDCTVRLWDPQTGDEVRRLEGHTGAVHGVCTVRLGERELLISASYDRTVLLWDSRSNHPTMRIPIHETGRCVTSLGASLVVGMQTGLLLIDFDRNPPGSPLT